MFKDDLQLKGKWRVIVSEGLLTKEEIKLIRKGKKVKKVKEMKVYHNVITTYLKEKIAQGLAGENAVTTADVNLTHQQLGTGTTTPTENDTNLENPDADTKKSVSSKESDGKKCWVTCTWLEGEATGTWREFGLWIGSHLFNRVAINITIAANETLTIDGELTIG